MKKVVIANCLECPNLINMVGEPIRCRKVKKERMGIMCSRLFVDGDEFPKIPHWCVLEDDDSNV